MYNHPNLSEIRGNPQKVLEAIDEYGKTKKYLMNVGEFKSKIVTDLIKQVKPKVMVELGGYCGYSAIAFGAALREAGGKRYYSLEYNPEFGAVISSLVDLAGLRDIVQVEIGASSASLKRLAADKTLEKIDMLFLDHLKPLYTPDLKLCEELGIVGPGSVLAADNGRSSLASLVEDYNGAAADARIYSGETGQPSIFEVRQEHDRAEEGRPSEGDRAGEV